jgi:hypothetical protein
MEVVHTNPNLKELFINFSKELIKVENKKSLAEITESDMSSFNEIYKGLTVSEFFSGLNKMLKENCPYDSNCIHPDTVGSCLKEYYWIIKRLSIFIEAFYQKMMINIGKYGNLDHYYYLGKKNMITTKQFRKKQTVKDKSNKRCISSKK